MLLVEIRLDSHQTPLALLKVLLLRTLTQLVVIVGAHFNNLGAPCTISKHGALQHIVQVHLVCIEEVRGGYPTKLANTVVVFDLGDEVARLEQGRLLSFQQIGKVVVWK